MQHVDYQRIRYFVWILHGNPKCQTANTETRWILLLSDECELDLKDRHWFCVVVPLKWSKAPKCRKSLVRWSIQKHNGHSENLAESREFLPAGRQVWLTFFFDWKKARACPAKRAMKQCAFKQEFNDFNILRYCAPKPACWRGDGQRVRKWIYLWA